MSGADAAASGGCVGGVAGSDDCVDFRQPCCLSGIDIQDVGVGVGAAQAMPCSIPGSFRSAEYWA